MTTVSHFSRQNDAGLRSLNVVLGENLLLVLVLESKGPEWRERDSDPIVENLPRAHLTWHANETGKDNTRG